MTNAVNINEVLDGHISLEIDCVDRLLLNAYVPNLQVSGQVVTFLTEHLGFPVPSPALLERIGNRFRREVKAFAAEHNVPVLTLKKPDRTRWDDRKIDHVRPSTKPRPKAAPVSSPSCRPRSSSGCSARRTARARPGS